MEKKIVISVIIPVYNAQKFIDRAVQSVLCQMDGTIELILVDDGSKDRSGEICDEYARTYDNIRVIHKENGGLSSARNAGISAASGEYLSFLDADDYLDPDTCKTVKTVITSYHPDLIDFGWKYVSASGDITENHHKIPKSVLHGEDLLREVVIPPMINLIRDPDHFIFDFSCTKVFRADTIRENRIKFDENRRIWEDRPFVVYYLRFCHNYYSIDRCFYNYVDMPGSLSRRYSMDFFRIIVENFLQYRSLFGSEYDFDTEYVNSYWASAVENMIYRSLGQKDNCEEIQKNIIEALGQEQVIHWFINRNCSNVFEKKQSALIAAGQPDKALREYRKRATINQTAQVFKSFRWYIIRIIRKKVGKRR